MCVTSDGWEDVDDDKSGAGLAEVKLEVVLDWKKKQ